MAMARLPKAFRVPEYDTKNAMRALISVVKRLQPLFKLSEGTESFEVVRLPKPSLVTCRVLSPPPHRKPALRAKHLPCFKNTVGQKISGIRPLSLGPLVVRS